jgi:hypothetical protein
MLEIGFHPAFAVPGAILEAAPEAYRAVAANGATFLNHGYARHSEIDTLTGRYRSTLFYDRLSLEAVEDDVRSGDGAVRAVLGRAPAGFRTPHFGAFSGVEQLSFLHGVLRDLGYVWSSSTDPLWSFTHGPVFSELGVREIPVTGCPSRPLSILDSWSFRADPDRRWRPGDFSREVAVLGDMLAGSGPLVVNLYGDPSQVHGWDEFFDALAALRPWASTFEALVEDAGG